MAWKKLRKERLCAHTAPESLRNWLARRGYLLSDVTYTCFQHQHKRCSGYRRRAQYTELDFCVCPCHGRSG